MPDERLITELESMLQQVIELGAEKERTRLGPNLLVTNAAPTGLSNYILVRDDRDGDNILALKVPGVVYNTNDLVNVLFVKGGEAIAFQQGAGSSSSGIWGIVPATSTDIYYNAGDVGIGKTVAPDARLELLDTAQAQLRLTHTEDTKYVTFTLDTNHDLTIDPSSTGQIILASADVVIEEDLIHSGDTDTKMIFTADDVQFTVGGLQLLKLTEDTQDVITLGAGSGDIDINFNGDMFLQGSDGFFGIATNTPTILLDISGGSQSGAIKLGADLDATTRTDNTRKLARMVMPHYDNDEENIAMFLSDSNTTTTTVLFGGGAGALNTATRVSFFVASNNTTLSGTEMLRVVIEGIAMGGAFTPQGLLHGYDTISGFLHWEYDGLDGTSRTIIPNGAGDVLYNLFGMYNFRDSAGAVASGTFAVANGGSTGLAVGGNTVTVAVAAAGTTTVSRTAGTDTIKVTFWLLWL